MCSETKSKSPGGHLYVFEGVDDVGKTTLGHGLIERIRNCGHTALYVAFPGNKTQTLGKLVYDAHHQPEKFGIHQATGAALQALHLAAHLDSIAQEIMPALTEGTDVVLDRYWWSTIAYGKVMGVSDRILERLVDVESECWNGIQPSRLFLIRRHNDESVPSLSAAPMKSALIVEYNKIAEREKGKYPIHIIDNDGSLDEALDKLANNLK